MLLAFLRSCRDLFRPRILAFVIIVPMISFFLWSMIGVSLFKAVGPQIENYIQNVGWLNTLTTGLTLTTILAVSADVVVALVMMLLLFPFVIWTSLVFTAAFAMPWILRILRPLYPTAFRSQTRVSLLSTWKVSLRVFLKVIPIYLVLLMLAWIPQIYLFGTFILSAWVNAYFMAVEVLSELTDEASLRAWIKAHWLQLFGMGAVMIGFLLVPFIQWVTPVFAGLWIAHYILGEFAKEHG